MVLEFEMDSLSINPIAIRSRQSWTGSKPSTTCEVESFSTLCKGHRLQTPVFLKHSRITYLHTAFPPITKLNTATMCQFMGQHHSTCHCLRVEINICSDRLGETPFLRDAGDDGY